MSNPKPSVGRGRARGRVKQDGDSPGISPVGVRQSGIPGSEHHIKKPDQLPSDLAADDLDQNRIRKNQRSRGRGKKPEVQLYIPRGRRSQDSSNGNSQSQESQCLESNSTECDQYTIPELKKQQGDTTDSHKKTDDMEKNLTSSDIKPVQTKPRKSRTAQVYMPPGRRREQEKGQSLSQSSEGGSDGDHWDVDNTDTTVRSQSKEKYIRSDEFGERSHGIDLSSEVKCLDVDNSTVCMSAQKIKTYEEQGTDINQEKSPREDQRIEFDNSVTFHSNDHQNVKECSTINNDTHNIDTKVDKCCKNEEELAKDIPSSKNENTTLNVCKNSEHLNTDILLQLQTNDNVHICENLDQLEQGTGDVSTKVHDKLDTVSSNPVREQIGSGNQSCMNNLTNISDSIENSERLKHSNNHDNSGKVINSDLSDDLMTSDAAVEQHEQSDNVTVKDKGYNNTERNTKDGSEVSLTGEINNTICDDSKTPFDKNVKTTTSDSDNDKSDLNMVNTEELQQNMASSVPFTSDLSRINNDLPDYTEDDTLKLGNSSSTSQNSSLDLSKNIHEVLNIENVKSDDTILSSGSNRTEECISMSHDSGAITLESHPVQSGEATDSQDKTELDACLKKESSDLRSENDESSLQSNSNDESNHSKHKVSESGENENSDLGSYKDSACSVHTTKKSTDVKSNASEKPVKGENSSTNTEKGIKNSSKVVVRNDKLAAFGWELYTDKTNESTAEKERAESEEKDKKKSGKKKTGKGKNKLKKKQDSAAESREINEQESETVVSEKKPIQSEEDESWDTMFDDDGESLDPNTLEELSSNVGKVKVKKPVINYLNYQPKEPELDYEGMNHVIEIYDFSSEMKTEDLLSAFSMFKSKGFDIKWVDDTHALGVFSSVIAANEALQFTHPLLKVGPLSQACRESKVKAKRAVEFLQPYKERPETTAVVARRMLTGALGLKTKVSKEQRDKETEEKRKLKQAKDKKKKERKQKDDIWEGNVTSE
ncbi:coiled-coil domain-containing protein R3HCC1L-like [Mytilus californianus]|uniref:coiled-coil domain-containing protein R3HCC1L-like n=1 Tax=Mytilus californianus TaxID=6549 RepID=UPI0022471101|nr:coiled-coil domain-containing protein R3HCC1L-like [Mytilus californianus]